jgi:hypothetical protein
MEVIGINKWETQDTDSFWAGMKETDHVIHLYDDEESLLNSLTGFASASLQSDFAIIIIASKPHLDLVDKNLRKAGYDVFGHTVSGRYLALEARDILSQFMFEGVPDKGLFSYMLSSFSLRSRRLGKKMRVFGELAGMLHSDGNHEGANMLEDLWTQYRVTAPFCFFRACRSSDLPQQPSSLQLSARYSVVIGGQTSLSTIFFRRLS